MVSGHPEPYFAGDHGGGQVGASDAGRERPQAAVGAGVAVGADHQVARKYQALFRQQRVLDAHLAAVEEVRQFLRLRELPSKPWPAWPT